jgi:phosphate transport system permease protein
VSNNQTVAAEVKWGRGTDRRLSANPLSSRRRVSNLTAHVLMGLAVLLAVIPVGMILFQIAQKGLATMNWEFLTSSMPFTFRGEGGGFVNALIGTLIMVGIATLVSVPLGILAAVYLVEYGKKNLLAQVIRFFSDVMTGVPSVFVGLFVYTALVVNSGFGALFGGFALAIIMLPIVARSTEEMLKLVPRDLKDGS